MLPAAVVVRDGESTLRYFFRLLGCRPCGKSIRVNSKVDPQALEPQAEGGFAAEVEYSRKLEPAYRALCTMKFRPLEP